MLQWSNLLCMMIVNLWLIVHDSSLFVQNEPDGYFCSCPLGYRGDNCETHLCDPNPCTNGGTCRVRFHLMYNNRLVCNEVLALWLQIVDDQNHCTCAVGYTGENCITEIDECSFSPCFHGNCTDLIGDYQCNCEEFYDVIILRYCSFFFLFSFFSSNTGERL